MNKTKISILLLCFVILFYACTVQNVSEAYTVINGNVPEFDESEITTVAFEYYSELDALGRCGTAFACIGEEIMPTEERGSIGQVKPSGWQLAKYDIVDGKYLYNRCHLIGYQLTGENANERNLITGTRYLNTEGMLPFENMVAEYVKETKNHVMYRVTPLFEGDNLLATGVQMEAYSVEDNGKGVSFNVFVDNVQPGIVINYLDGTNRLETDGSEETSAEKDSDTDNMVYVLNTNSMKFHRKDCSSIKDIKTKNKEDYSGTREWLISNGYSPCGACNP
ncbi:MAG: DNA/RNA non-specific endonuclease [Clostridia bacterium]|nr:DNA/RNA non-specific endonuclease [Clostridia bacterium]